MIYNAYMSGQASVVDDVPDAMEAIQGKGDAIQVKQSFQKSFLIGLIPLTTPLDFNEFRQCFYSNDSCLQRKSYREVVYQNLLEHRSFLRRHPLDTQDRKSQEQKLNAFECLLKIDAFQDENWQEVGYKDNFYSLLRSTIKELRGDPVVKVLQEWKTIIW